MSTSRDEAFMDWKGAGLEQEKVPQRCDDCRSCIGGPTRPLWALFAGTNRFILWVLADMQTSWDVVNSQTPCPRCLHNAFWHTGTM